MIYTCPHVVQRMETHGPCETTRGLTGDFWKHVEPLLPEKQRNPNQRYVRKPGGGRKPKDP